MKNQEIVLNKEQQEAVNHDNGSLLIIAGAGTGKTTVVTERIKRLITEKKALPDEILALTFTEKAAQQMEKRVDVALPYGTFGLWISTFHSFCDRILRSEAINVGLSPGFKLMTDAETYLLVKKNFWSFHLKYFRPQSNPYKFIEGLIQHFSRLKDEDITPEKYLDFAKSAKEDKDKYLELAKAFKTYELLKIKEEVMDFSDLIINVLNLFRKRKEILAKYQKKFKYILVDEFQDTNFAQYQLIKLMAELKTSSNITVVGDDSQCLPGNTTITTALAKKRIDQIKKGEKILTAIGKGHTSISKVKNVFRRHAKVCLLTFVLEDGKKITLTNNHKMFCYIPSTEINKQYCYVYIMWQVNIGWRIGVTKDLASRLRLEHHADSIIGIGSYKTEAEARFFESYYSTKYNIPTVPFNPRQRQAIAGKWLKKLYDEIDTKKSAAVLAKDLSLELDSPHFLVNGVKRGVTDRVKINLHMCYRNHRSKTHKRGFVSNPSVQHAVWVETSSKKTIRKLISAGIKLTRAKKGFRYRFSTSDLKLAWQVAERLLAITDGILDKKFSVGTIYYQHKAARIMPASHILPGNYLPVCIDKKIIYKKVVKRVEELKQIEVFDLEVDKTHNFIANGVVVHNSIYKFRGAAISNILSFMKDYPESKSVILTTSYRSPQTILDASYKLIKNNNPNTLESQLGISKNLKAKNNHEGEKIELIHTDRVEEEAEKIVHFIRDYKKENKKEYKDFAILVRANNHSDAFIRAFERARVPYQFLGPGMLFQQPEIKDLIAYLKVLYDFTDSVSLYRVLSMDLWNIEARDLIAVLNKAKRSNISLFEQLEQIIEINISDDSKNKLKNFVDMVHKQQKLIPKETAGQILYYFLIDSGLLKLVVDYKTQAQEKKALNITKFFDKLKSFEATHRDASIFTVVDYLDLAMNMGESPMAAEIDWSEVNAVNILTVHSAKGLEFPVVFLTNLIEGRFPSRERKDKIPIPDNLIQEILPTGDYHLQEERRLFYVGMTRAKEKLILSASNFYGEGKRERKMSPFIGESLGIENLYNTAPSVKHSQIPLFEWEKRTEPVVENISVSKYNLGFLSYSAIQSFQICPLHFKLRYILRVPTPPTPSLSIGNSVHNALRDFYTLKKDGENEKELILNMLDNNWIRYGFTSKKHEEQSKELAKTFLLNYLKDPLHLNAKPIYIEKGFNFKIDPNLKILGKIDRVDDLGGGKIEIIDYKTGANIPRQKDLDSNLQMTLYALAAINPGIFAKKVDQIKLSLYFFDNSTKMTTYRSKEQLEEATDELLKIRDKITYSDFKCSRGIICQNCEYKILCNG